MFDSPLSASPYEVLGVADDATDDELRRAYRQRLRETHPDTGGDAAVFIRVQRAWELVGTAEARAAYDRGHGFADAAPGDGDAGWAARQAPADTRPRARSYGHPGGLRRERYLHLVREWAGRGVELADPYDPQVLRSAPRELRRMLADALAEEATARTIADLGIGYTVWHDVASPARGAGPEDKIDHVVVGPSGVYGIRSEDFGDPVGFRRGELHAPHIPGAPVSELLGDVKALSRAAGVRFSGAIVVLPDGDLAQAITELGRVRGLPVTVTTRSALATVLRRGIPGAREVGGNELFDARTRLGRVIRHV